jgi:hypothetical protein
MEEPVMNRLRRLLDYLIGEIAYLICESLCGYVARRTSCEMLNASATLAAVETLDIEALLATPEASLPNQIRGALPAFTEREWREVLNTYFNRSRIEEGLEEPGWSQSVETHP